MRRITALFIAALLLAALLSGCGKPAAPAATPEPAASASAAAPSADPTPEPATPGQLNITPTPGPEITPGRIDTTPTPRPTPTPAPTPIPTPELTPVDFVPVTDTMGEDWPWLPEGAVPLSGEELASWQFMFDDQPMRTQFLTSAYEKPEDVDLYQLFYNGTTLGGAPLLDTWLRDPEEGSYLLRHLGTWPFAYDTVKIPRADMERFLKACLGLGLEDMSRVGLDWLWYIPETDAWYTAHGDTNRQQVKFLYGYILGNEVCLFHRGIAFYQGVDQWTGDPAYTLQQGVFRTVIRLWEAEEDFHFFSNLLALTDGAEARYAPPGSVNPSTLDLSGDYGRDAFRLEPEAADYGSFDAALASLEDLAGFSCLLEEEHPDYGTLVYGEAGEEPYLFFITSAGIRYRLHLPAASRGTLPMLQDWDEESKGWILDPAVPELEVEWLLNCDALTDLGNGELRRLGQARWTLYLPTMEEFVLFSPFPRTPLEGMELRYRDIAIGDTVERMYSLLGEPEACTEHRYTDPDPPQGLEYREYGYDGAVFREAYTEEEGWTGVIGQIEIRDTGGAPGPRGLCIGDAPEDVLAHFPKEYDYWSDTYSRFYGLPPYDGAGGCAYPGPDGEVSSIILTTDEVEPFLRIDFLDGKAVRLFMGCSWI